MAGVQQPVKIQHGHIWLLTLDPTLANEQAGVRPCVVVSVDRFNALPIRQAIVVPVTSRERGLPHHIRIVDDGGLDRPSWAMCEGLRTVSTQRFKRRISVASQQTVEAISAQIGMWLGTSN
ncbi:type II toxin-antitoxin system PemK/MazF family toxin [Crossiella sp. CA198]|uniref:type II toxin-antitoxin system PemK/MazF family toxin n=1 Tax=Crossiella sp. CA198 TaxID=3455607 RepID=UPI003F8D192D